MSKDMWIVVPNWDKFQHYKDRDPSWIKNYLALLHNDDYLRLSGHQRSILHGLWLAYASAHCQLRADTASLTRQLGLRVSSRHLELLNHAGFIELSASRPLALARSREAEEEKEKETPPPPFQKRGPGQIQNPRPADRLLEDLVPPDPDRVAKIRELAAGIGKDM